MSSADERRRRQHERTASKDQRNAFQKDRDRVQYSSAFHRLAGVTQIVRAGEAGVFHTRQQHTYKVAQVGRRLAENLSAGHSAAASPVIIDPEVVEAASLAHDLGHPPFGHAGEEELNLLVQKTGDSDGFEGNAQTFRILTKLAVRYPDCEGLNLTRATLAATLKYPWLRDVSDPKRRKKWGAYKVDEAELEFARQGYDHREQAPEAAVMDWADDISYSVHDLEDFHRVGAIPWALVLESKDDLVRDTYDSWFGASPSDRDNLDTAFEHLSLLLDGVFGQRLRAPYDGSREQRVALRELTSFLIGRFVEGTHADDSVRGIRIDPRIEAEVKLLKQITKDYITSSPALIAQQRGQRRIIRDLFGSLHEGAEHDSLDFLPAKLRYIREIDGTSSARFAADCISSMTEHEVIAIHGRLYGSLAGSVLDPIVR